MCDYSLHHVASRPASVGDKLVSTTFVTSYTRGFAAVGEPNIAVCLSPGTELAFEENLKCEGAFGFGYKRLPHRVARFRQVNKDKQEGPAWGRFVCLRHPYKSSSAIRSYCC
jgi:hypothetical protein